MASQSSSSKNPSLVTTLMEQMNPQCCLSPQPDEPLDDVIPSILNDLNHHDTRTDALKRLFIETDLAHQDNRIPIVCTSKWDIVAALSACLDTHDRRLVCLILNNLSIPSENKAVLCFGQSSKLLMDGVLNVIVHGHAESYLCCILLMNLSYLDDAKRMFVNYTTTGNDRSLLRTMELLFKTYTRYVKRKVKSAEGEAVRWATGLIRNLTSIQEGACRIASQTSIPSYMIMYVRDTCKPLHEWTQDSLEDFSLQTLMNLAKYEESLQHLQKLDCDPTTFDGIVGQGGIHDMRATVLKMKLGL